jgi:hypothetical protein
MIDFDGRERSDWLMLVMTLAGQKPALRMRIWRTLRTLGAASLRNGVYVLPSAAAHGAALRSLKREVLAAGGSAQLLEIRVPTAELAGAFDRTDEYRRLDASIARVTRRLRTRASGLRDARRLQIDLERVAARDFFPTDAQERTRRALEAFRARVDRAGDVGEPRSAQAALPRLDPSAFRGRTWVTRARPWVDRLASAWLIRRFIDPGAVVRWRRPPVRQARHAVGFDFDGATFTHHADRVTFEVLLHSFSLDGDVRLAAIASIVRCLDVGGDDVPGAPVLEAILRGMRDRIQDDDELLAQASLIFDDLYSASTVAGE